MRILFEVVDVETRLLEEGKQQARLELTDGFGNSANLNVEADPGERLPEPGDVVEQILTLRIADHNVHMQDDAFGGSI